MAIVPNNLPKFIVRFETKVQRESVRRAAKIHRRSMNFFVLEATMKATRETLAQQDQSTPSKD